MGDVVNLNKARKARDKVKAGEQARENRARFGRDKAEKSKAKLEAERAERTLDGAKRED